MEVTSPHESTNVRKFGYRNGNNIPVGPVRIRVGSGAEPHGLSSAPNPRPRKLIVCVLTTVILSLTCVPIALALAPTGGARPVNELTTTTRMHMYIRAMHTTIEDYGDSNIPNPSVAILADVATPVSQAPTRKSARAWFLPARVQSWSTAQDTRRASPGDPRFENSLKIRQPMRRDHPSADRRSGLLGPNRSATDPDGMS